MWDPVLIIEYRNLSYKETAHHNNEIFEDNQNVDQCQKVLLLDLFHEILELYWE